MRFSELVAVDRRPEQATAAERVAVDTDSYLNQMADEPRNNGFVSGLVDRRRGQRLKATRRTFLRGTIAAAAATTAVSAANLFGPARKVEAQSGVVGAYPRRILQFCPPYNSGDNCQPGCGSSPICTDCCGADGFFRNDPGNGYTLYAGGCGDGDIADGWLWRFSGKCGNCAEIEYRCSDGYVQTDTGPAPFICRTVTDCVPLGEGEAPGESLPDAARSTNWRPAGALEVAIDQGSTVSINGWIADGSGVPVDMRITANGQIVHWGKAALSRPDIEASRRGAGPNTGFGVSFSVPQGPTKFCVDAISGLLTSTIGCVNLDVGSGGSVRGSGPTGSIAAPSTGSSSGSTAGTGDATPSAVMRPERGPISNSRALGSVQVIRRSGSTTGFVSGWAGDPDTEDPVVVAIFVDGEQALLARADLPRPDVAAAFSELHSNTGFAVSFAIPAEDSDICISVLSPDDGRTRQLACQNLGSLVEEAAEERPDEGPTASGSAESNSSVVYGGIDRIDVATGGITVAGWAFDPNERDRVIAVEVEAAGSVAVGETGLENTAAQRIYGVDASCGFQIDVPVPIGQHAVTVMAVTGSGSSVAIGQQTVDIA